MQHGHSGSTLTGTIFNIQRYAIHDGPGIRTTVFFQGCPLRCWWCHNPESQQSDLSPSLATENGFGRRITSDELMREIEKDVLFFDESGGGVTFSGGEPLMQPEFLLRLLRQCADQSIHTAIDTCGYAPEEIFQSMLAHVDLVLYDLKILDDAAHQRYTGVSNRLVLNNLRLLSVSDIPYNIRFPIVPGITDTQVNIDAILAFLDELHDIQYIHLLPYHNIATHKYERLQWKYRTENVAPPEKARLQALQRMFEAHGFQTRIGG